jgi:protein-S-isoprenylcysteine O-methyltransferase Ste14
MSDKQKPKVFFGIAVLASLFIILTGPIIIQNIPLLLTQFFGFLLIGWSLLSIKINKHISTRSLPKENFLVTKGPYEIIRHPIYAGVLLIMAGYVQEELSLTRFFAFVIVLVAIILKIIYEESLLDHHVKEYAQYKAKTHKIIPYIY